MFQHYSWGAGTPWILPGPATSSGPQSQVPDSPPSTPFASPSSLPSGGDAGTAPGSPDASGGALGGFGSITEACAAVSATVLSVLALPMAAATGQDTAEAEKAIAPIDAWLQSHC